MELRVGLDSKRALYLLLHHDSAASAPIVATHALLLRLSVLAAARTARRMHVLRVIELLVHRSHLRIGIYSSLVVHLGWLLLLLRAGLVCIRRQVFHLGIESDGLFKIFEFEYR